MLQVCHVPDVGTQTQIYPTSFLLTNVISGWGLREKALTKSLQKIYENQSSTCIILFHWQTCLTSSVRPCQRSDKWTFARMFSLNWRVGEIHMYALLNVYETCFVPSLQNRKHTTIFLHIYIPSQAFGGNLHCNFNQYQPFKNVSTWTKIHFHIEKM